MRGGKVKDFIWGRVGFAFGQGRAGYEYANG